MCEEAALALGSSKLEGAAALLVERWQKRRKTEPFEIWIRALGASRLPAAFACLVEIIGTGRPEEASTVLGALQSRRLSIGAWEEVASALRGRGDAELESIFESEFPRPEAE